MSLPSELLDRIAEMSADSLDAAFPTPRDSPAPGADRVRWIRRIVYDHLRLDGFFEFCWRDGDLTSITLAEEQVDVLRQLQPELETAGWTVALHEGDGAIAGCVAWPSKVERFQKIMDLWVDSDDSEDSDDSGSEHAEDDMLESITQTIELMRALG